MPRKSKPLKHEDDADAQHTPIDWSTVDNETFEFKITFNPDNSSSRKRKRGAPQHTTPQYQQNPLEGCGLPPVSYAVTPRAWEGISRYRKFTIFNETFEVHNCVLVSLDPEEDVPAPRNRDPKRSSLPVDAITNKWIAHVLEVRAADEQHVFLRVNWLYRPEDLPNGREPHHGAAELVPSNFMQIIDAMAVDGKVDVKRWDEANEDEDPNPEGLYFRQWYNSTTNQLSPVREHCVCKRPSNPDKLLIRCSNASCKRWLHAECLEEQAVRDAYKQAGETYPESDADFLGKPSSKSKRKSKGSQQLTNGTSPPELDYEATLLKPKGAREKYTLQVTGPLSTNAVPYDTEVRCLACHEAID